MGEFHRFKVDDTAYITRHTRKFENRKPYVPVDPHRFTAAIPGIVEAVHVHEGQQVRRGEKLVTVEAMKMKNDLRATQDAVVDVVRVKPGQMVAKGELLLDLR